MTDPVAYEMEREGETPKAIDRQVGGSHYKDLGYGEPWKIMEVWDREHFKGFLRYNALKRLGRWNKKEPVLCNIEKAIHELQRLAELLREDEEVKKKKLNHVTPGGKSLDKSWMGVDLAAGPDVSVKTPGPEREIANPDEPNKLAQRWKDTSDEGVKRREQ